MQRLGPTLAFSPADLNHFLECEYVTRLDVEGADGRQIPIRRHAEAEMLASRGEAHERGFLARLRADGRRVSEIADPATAHGWEAAARETRAAMAARADVIYQAVLVDEGWRGRADFLIRTDRPSGLGAWSFEAWDTKLARRARPSHLLQLAYYTDRLGALQQLTPEWMHLVLGTGEQVRFRSRDFLPYYRAVRRRFLRRLATLADAAPYPVAHCGVCGYIDHCDARWTTEDHLCLVANIRPGQVDRLHDAGVTTMLGLAAVGDAPGIGVTALGRLRQQAGLQAYFRTTGTHRYELLAPSEENGFRLLPPPSPGDIFFDMEGFPFFEPTGGLEYLFGAAVAAAAERGYEFTAFRATDRASEKRAFERFVDLVWDRLCRWPELHVYHYSHYEPTALKRLTAPHATREREVDELLRREVFVDLYQVVRRSLRISHDSYSIKAVRQFFMPDAGKGAVIDGVGSVVEFQRWLDTGDSRILDAIERYNEEDCVSTLRLRDWLLARKREAEQQFGAPIPAAALSKRRAEPVEVEDDEHAALRARLVALGDAGATLLGHLLDYHRREAKPEWWAYFLRRKKTLDELLDDTEAISYLTPVADPPEHKDHSLVHTLAFPPQEFKLKPDTGVDGPLGQGSAGTIEWIDASRGRLGLRRGKKRAADALPSAIIAGGPVPDKAQRAAIARIADALVRGSEAYRAVTDLLRREKPRFTTARAGSIQTSALDEQRRLVAELDESYLVIQGPPGSGKTWTGARLIAPLLTAGRTVGVTGPNHKAIHNLLEEVERVAHAEGRAFHGIKKRSTSDETAYDGRFIRSVQTNEQAEGSSAQLVAGTGWLFAREGMDRRLDYLFVDEAGQLALADVVAVGTAARNLVLLGDPQQLPHVAHSSHPDGSGASALAHLLGDAATVSEDRGIFLASSWRMHPNVCQFVSEHSYDGRLASAAGCERQEMQSPGLSGAGLRFLPVEHRHNSQQSAEEAAAIAREVDLLLRGGTVTDCNGAVRPLEAADILVVTPFNMQVRCLREALPDAIEVGTVDRFQGREAAVVFFSMAASSGDEVPRGLEFLFNRNRFNVAISRARCLAIVVCSPRLLETRCRTVEQIELVNALCRFAEGSAGGEDGGRVLPSSPFPPAA
jgi:uncharacterized protein